MGHVFTTVPIYSLTLQLQVLSHPYVSIIVEFHNHKSQKLEKKSMFLPKTFYF